MLVGAVRVAFRALHLDHVGAEVGEHHPGARAGDERALFDDPDSAEWRVEHQAPGTNPAGAAPVVGDAGGPGVREDETDRTFLFLEQVRDQARGAGEDRDALDREQREAGIEHHGGDRAGDVHDQRLAGHLRAASSR